MTAATIGVYGKVDTQGDFLRAGSGDFSRAGLDRWLEEGMGVLKTENAALPEGAAGFLFAPAGAARAFLGALAPSEDSVGRKFPLLAFVELPAGPVAMAMPAAATAYGAVFVAASSDLVLSSRGVAAADLFSRARDLAAAAPAEPSGDEAVSLAAAPSGDLRAALGGGAPALAYALRTLCLACDQAAKAADPAAPGLTVDAPAPSPMVRAMWLELALRRLRRAHAPAPRALLWSDGSAGRLLISLGTPPPAMFAFWANPRHRSQRLWPLRTEVAAALATATSGLTSAQRRIVDDPSTSLAQLVAEFE
ncbi:MAG TPA: type VI secretion system-associated protein TagF [Polyangia bacterium]|jgi:type VI secretion system protein ImpM|nr:type VI secretion system-associated protein TagF [Polyangia bacterium]